MAMSGYQPLTDQEVTEIAGQYFQQMAIRTAKLDRPAYVLVGGQPGAGKSTAGSVVRAELAQAGGFMHIDADRMRERIDTKGTKPSSDETQQDAARLVTELRELATAGRRNVLEEGTFRNSEVMPLFIDAMQSDGYQMEMVAVSTARDESLLGIYQRYEAQHAAGANNPRFVSAKYHDEAMQGFEKTLAQNERRFDRVRVITRAGEVLFDSNAKDNKAASAAQALRDGQTLSDARLKAVADSWRIIEEHAKGRGADAKYLDSIDENREICRAEMQARMRAHALKTLDANMRALNSDARFSSHSSSELAAAAYFRGVYEKSGEFAGEAVDFVAYDNKMANRSAVRQLPDPEVDSLDAEKKRSRGREGRHDDGLSL